MSVEISPEKCWRCNPTSENEIKEKGTEKVYLCAVVDQSRLGVQPKLALVSSQLDAFWFRYFADVEHVCTIEREIKFENFTFCRQVAALIRVYQPLGSLCGVPLYHLGTCPRAGYVSWVSLCVYLLHYLRLLGILSPFRTSESFAAETAFLSFPAVSI